MSINVVVIIIIIDVFVISTIVPPLGSHRLKSFWNP